MPHDNLLAISTIKAIPTMAVSVDEFKNIPTPIGALPSVIPTYAAVENLKAMYQYIDDEQHEWRASVFNFGDTDSEDLAEGDRALCAGDIENDMNTANANCSYVSWYSSVKNAEGAMRTNLWIVEVSGASSRQSRAASYTTAPGTNEGSVANPPADIAPTPPTPSPLPTFVPKTTAGVKIDKSLRAVLRHSKNGLEAVPPETECEDGENPILVYDVTNKEMMWECREHYCEEAEEVNEYRGYFAIRRLKRTEEDIQKDQVRVAVCDGATWDPDKETSGDSIYYLNGYSYRIPCTKLTLTKTNKYVVFQHIVGEPESTATVIAVDKLSTETAHDKLSYTIGELYIQSMHEPEIIQRHGVDVGYNQGNGEIRLWEITDICDLVYRTESNE